MPTIQVGDSVELAYHDSGPPASSPTSYVTVVLVHGTIFHNKIYSKVLALAEKYSLRFLAVNMRDYPGSTPNSKEELDDLGNEDPNRQARYIKSSALEIGTFVAKAITTLDLPALSGEGRGGVAILGWSSGTLYMTSLLAHADDLPQGEKDLVSRFLRTVVLLDPAWFPTGHLLPSAVLTALPGSPLYSPMRDMSITDAERIAKFFAWFSAYFEPPVKETFTIRTDDDIKEAVSILDARVQTGTPTLQRMTPADKSIVADFSEQVKTSNQMIRFVSRTVYKDNYLRAFSIADDASALWPNVDVLVAWGEQSVFETSWVASTIRDWLEHGSRSAQNFGPSPNEIAGRRARKVRYGSMEGCNHFMPWDDAEKVVKFLAQNL